MLHPNLSLPMASSSSSSFRAPIAVGTSGNSCVQLWLPENFNSMLGQLIFQEESETDRGALNRCLHGLHLQTFSSDALASQNFLSEATLSEMRLSKYEIVFGNGVDPFRLKVLCDMLLAAARLFDEELLRENHGVLESLPPYCSACDVFGL